MRRSRTQPTAVALCRSAPLLRDGAVVEPFVADSQDLNIAVRSYPASIVVEYLTRGVFFESIRRTVHSAAHVVERLASRAK